MGSPDKIAAVKGDRAFFSRALAGASVPPVHVFTTGAAAAGAGTIDLTLATVDGAAATAPVELEHDQPILIPSSNTVAAAAAGTLGSYTLTVDDGSAALPTDLIAVDDYITIAGDTRVYRVTARETVGATYKIRVTPDLKAAPADNAVITVYNTVRVNLAGSTQFFDVATTATSTSVAGIKYAIADASSSRGTYVYRKIIGIETLSLPPSVESTEITNMEFTATLQGSTSFEASISGQKLEGDAAIREVILPKLLDPDRANEGLFLLVETARGTVVQGPAAISDGDAESTAAEAESYDYTAAFTTGSNFQIWVR